MNKPPKETPEQARQRQMTRKEKDILTRKIFKKKAFKWARKVLKK